MTDSIGARLRRALFDTGLNQSDVSRLTGLDKNAVSAIVNDKSRPRPATLDRIERALGMTPGTLSGSGEDAPAESGHATAAGLSDEELVAELGYRLTRLKRENADLAARAGDGHGDVIDFPVRQRWAARDGVDPGDYEE